MNFAGAVSIHQNCIRQNENPDAIKIHVKSSSTERQVIPMIEKENAEVIIGIISALAPILIAIVTIIPTIISNRKKTQESIDAMKKETTASFEQVKAEMAKNNKEMNEKVDAVSKQLSAHVRENEDDNARQTRARILNFYDEVCEGKLHSESHFEDILDDIDDYENYTELHKEFKNSRGKAAMQYIRDTYHKVKEKGGFLIHTE